MVGPLYVYDGKNAESTFDSIPMMTGFKIEGVGSRYILCVKIADNFVFLSIHYIPIVVLLVVEKERRTKIGLS